MESPVDLPDRTKRQEVTQKPPKEKAPKPPKPQKGPTPPNAKNQAAAAVDDLDSMFKVGFLADVYNEKPICLSPL